MFFLLLYIDKKCETNCKQEKTNICSQLQESMPNTKLQKKLQKKEIADLDGMEDIDCSLTKIRFSEDIRLVW